MVAVIDGASSKTTRLFDGKTPGRVVMELIVERLKKFYKENIKDIIEKEEWKKIFHEEKSTTEDPVDILNIVLTDENNNIKNTYL